MYKILALFIVTQSVFYEVYSTDGSDVSCSGCFGQKWDSDSWQCEVNCDVENSKYGKALWEYGPKTIHLYMTKILSKCCWSQLGRSTGSEMVSRIQGHRLRFLFI